MTWGSSQATVSLTSKKNGLSWVDYLLSLNGTSGLLPNPLYCCYPLHTHSHNNIHKQQHTHTNTQQHVPSTTYTQKQHLPTPPPHTDTEPDTYPRPVGKPRFCFSVAVSGITFLKSWLKRAALASSSPDHSRFMPFLFWIPGNLIIVFLHSHGR